ncbi:MAG: hypothetical protein ACO29O_06205, partial [Chitinophagaceae bacterium]
LVIWYGSRLIILIRRPHIYAGHFQQRAIKFIPIILAVIPVLIIVYAILQAVIKYYSFSILAIITYTWSLAIILALLILIFIKEHSISFWLNKNFKSESKISIRKFSDLFKIGSHRIALLSLFTIMCVLLFLFLLPQNIGFARWLQPATIVLIGLFFFSFLFTIFFLIFDLRRSPVFLIVIFYIVSISIFNNNAAIRTIDNTPLSNREGIKENFIHWIHSRNFSKTNSNQITNTLTEINTKSSLSDSIKKFPIVIIASEGGGIRSTAWTAKVLQKLNQEIPSFHQNIFAISAVSGGSVGSLFQLCYLHDLYLGKFKDLPEHKSYFQKSITGDFLSDLTASLIFHDNIQRIIPLPLPALSRNHKLENSWSISYRHELFSNIMDSPFLDLWQTKAHANMQLPNLFLNCMISETGQKAIVSNLALDKNVFSDDVDILKILNRNIPVKTSASMSSQFPIITPGALLKKNDQKEIGHILDGGYKDNSGLETAMQIISLIHDEAKKVEKEKKIALPIYLVFIRNSGDPSTIENNTSSTRIMPDFATIIPGFMNAWNRKTQLYSNSIKLALEHHTLGDEFKYFEIRLDNSKKFLPLGWYLSDSAKAYIDLQVETINSKNEFIQTFKSE